MFFESRVPCNACKDASREAVLLRFHRSISSQDHQQKEGFGLGLSIVAAILRLHNFGLEFKDNAVGTHVRITCANDSVQNNG